MTCPLAGSLPGLLRRRRGGPRRWGAAWRGWAGYPAGAREGGGGRGGEGPGTRADRDERQRVSHALRQRDVRPRALVDDARAAAALIRGLGERGTRGARPAAADRARAAGRGGGPPSR